MTCKGAAESGASRAGFSSLDTITVYALVIRIPLFLLFGGKLQFDFFFRARLLFLFT